MIGTRVPTWLTSFVGRVDDLAALHEAIDASRWVAIVGPPGVGKTRLLGELVRDRASFGDVWWVDVSAAATIAEAAATIATVFDVATAGGTVVERIAAASVRRGPTLVVLDEVDALGEQLAALVAGLLAGAANLRIATTSRSRTAATTATYFDVGPLERGDAIEMFAQRAHAVQRGFTATRWEWQLTELVDALDRLPLAIELAAARVCVMTPAQLVERPWLVFGEASRDRLRAALDSTWESLTEPQRIALAQLAVFRGGFDLDAAIAIVDVASPITDVLAALRDKSLVVARPSDAGIRFDMLTIVREYLRARPADPTVGDRHARYFVGLAGGLIRRLDGVDAERSRHALARERANLLAIVDRGRTTAEDAPEDALAAAIAVAAPQIRSGSYRELSEFLAAPLALVDDRRRPALCAEAWWLRGEALRQAGHLEEAASCYDRVQVLGERTGDAGILGRAGYGAAALALSRGELAAAVALYQTRVVDLAGVPDPIVLTRALSDLGVIQTVLEKVDDARLTFDRAFRTARAARCVTGEGRALIGLGQLEQQAGRLDEARGYYVRALEIHERVGDQRSIAFAHHQLGMNHHLRKQLGAAAERYRAALAIAEPLGHRLLTAIVLCALGSCAHAGGQLDEARRHFEHAATAFEELEHASYRAAVTARLAALLADEGDTAGARSLLESAAVVLLANADREVTEGIALCRTHVELASGGDPQRARAHLEAALAGAVDVRVQAIILARRLEDGTPPKRRLAVGPRARWFAVDDRDRVRLERRGPPSRILAALVESRITVPGNVVLPDELFEFGWPGQRASSESAAQRVYTAIWTLRKLGLRDVIARVAEGYFIDPAIDLVRRDE